MNQKDLYDNVIARLKENPQITSPELEARWIIERALGSKVESEDALQDPSNLDFIDQATKKRIEGIPLAYVLGEKEFYGLNFMVNPSVLIPRPESELVVEAGLKHLRKLAAGRVLRVLDLGTGSGCIGLSVLKHCPDAHLCAVEMSVDALDVTDFNAKSLGVHERTTLLSLDAANLRPSDLPENFAGKVDLVVANPPYIEEGDQDVDPWVTQYEPAIALFSDEGGLGHFRRWVQCLPHLLDAPGLALFEIGHTQGESAVKIVKELNEEYKCWVEKDYSNRDRVVCIERT